ncbi:MAG: 50S ribosomal protein L1 [Candidatus Doudnabacteria bacterium]
MAKASKRLRANTALVDRTKFYTLDEAVELAKKTANTKFNGSLEVHVRLGTDPKKTDQSVRGNVTLPHGTGKTKKIAAFVTETNEKAAREAGAVIVGGEELIKSIRESEKTDFEVAVAEPAMMAKMAPIAKILGQRGLMPNPKNGTVTQDIVGAIKEIGAGKVNFKNDDSANVHQIIGKANFDSAKLVENLKTFLDALNASKPTSVKKQFIMAITLNSSMGPGIKVKM